MVFSKFESFTARPPTPPKDLNADISTDIQDALDFIKDPFGTSEPVTRPAIVKSLLNTPEQSPSSEIGTSSTGSRTKKVNFELPPCSAPVHSWTPQRSSPLRPLSQTRVLKPLKSILKPSDQTTPSPLREGTAAHKFQTFAEMLESIVKQLAQSRRPSRLDAYISLHKTITAYENVPDIQALINKMPLLCDYIERDMQAVGINGSGSDSQLINQAIKLLMALVRVAELRNVMTDDFGSRIVDRIIKVAEDASMPKAIINVHLALLMQQNFRPKTMTIARTEKILDILDSIHDRVTGYSVQAYRIRIYKKLIQQRPEVMTKHTERWLKHVIKAMLANQKEIHQSALDVGITAVKTIGHECSVTKSVLSIMNRVRSDGNTFAALLAEQMDSMLRTESAPLVPQVWGVLTAFLRDSLDANTFTASPAWLKTINNFFSSDNDQVKVNSNIAANLLVYAVNLTHSTNAIWSRIFLSISQHRLTQPGQNRKPETDTATSGYLTLLYYALRPTASHAQLDRYWKEYVADFWRPLASSSPKHAIAACRVSSALLNGSRKPWNEQRALELRPQLLVQREELPLLDPKWVRKALATVLQFVEVLLDVTPWQADVGGDEPVKTMWIALLNSLVEASSKEVMATSETRDAVAHIVNMLQRMWNKHTAELALPQHKEDSWADKFCFLLETVVQKLGALQFSEKCLTRNGQDSFEVASTPSHRSRQHGPRTSPLLCFVDLLVSQSEGKLSDPVRLRGLQQALEPCYNAHKTRMGKLELLRDCAAAATPSPENAVALKFWEEIASLSKHCIQQASDSNERQSRQLGKEYEMIVEILAFGDAPLLGNQHGQELLSTFVETVRREAGDGAVVLAAVERVSEHVLLRPQLEDRRCCLPFASILLKSLPKNIIRRILDQGRQNLYPSSPAPTRGQEFDPYNHFYAAINSIMSAAYHNLTLEDTGNTKDFLAALAVSIQQSPNFLFAVYLRKIQQTLRLWVEDPDRKLQNKKVSAKGLHTETLDLWKTICEAVRKLPRKDSSILVTLEPLISAGFMSRRRSIVNSTIETWNETFGKEETLRYPTRLEEALRRLCHTAELSLPTLEIGKTDIDDQASFYESEVEETTTPRSTRDNRAKESAYRVRKSSRKTRSKSKSRSPAVSAVSESKRSSHKVPKVRLRHEDSQIVFEPIVSSPTNPFQQESQILTERQREMIARQHASGNLFSAIGARPTSESDMQTSSHEPELLLSDNLASDDLPHDDTQTPLNTLEAMGPMDAYLGSSPTPHARTRQSQLRSDATSAATPTASRSINVLNNIDELGSSPPRLQHDTPGKSNPADSFEPAQQDRPFPESVEEGTTIEDHRALPESILHDRNETPDHMAEENPLEDDMTDVASSTGSAMESQLNAQLNYEISAHLSFSTKDTAPQDTLEDSNLYVDARSQRQMSVDDDASSADPSIQNGKSQAIDNGANDSSTSFIEDSFQSTANKEAAADQKSQVTSLRRSSRHASTPSPKKFLNGKKRKQSPVETPMQKKRSRKSKKDNTPIVKVEPGTGDEELEEEENDCIVVESTPVAEMKKTRSKLQSPAKNQITVPETGRKRCTRRSTSLLSQVETMDDDEVIEGTPAAKISRKSRKQDVSDTKNLSPHNTRNKNKRLSHIQVTPRTNRSSASPNGSSEKGEQVTVDEPAEGTQADSVVEGSKRGSTPEPQNSEEASLSLPIAATPNRSFTERVIRTPRSIIAQVRKMITECKEMVLGKDEEREFDDVLFEFRTTVHDAGARGQGRQ